MLKKYPIYILLFISLVLLDQYIKRLFVDGYELQGDCISLVLNYNKGVAFSMFSFLSIYLKYIQILILLISVIYLSFHKNILLKYQLPIILILSGGISNIYDRFIHKGVVDYVYWHCGFNFAIFNLADVFINIAIALILLIHYLDYKKSTQTR